MSPNIVEEEFGKSSVTNKDIETAYIETAKVTFDNTQFKYELNFAIMKQKSLSAGKIHRAVIRRPATFVAKINTTAPTAPMQMLCASFISGDCISSNCPNLHSSRKKKSSYQ